MESIGSSQASAGSRSLAGHSTMIGGGSSPLASDVLQQQEEERLYALQKGRTFVGSSPTAAAAPSVVPPAPVSLQASFESVYADRLGACDSPGLAPPSAHPPLLTAADDAGSLQSTGAIFLTRFSRRNSSSSALARASPLGPNSVGPPCGPRTSIPDRMVRCLFSHSTRPTDSQLTTATASDHACARASASRLHSSRQDRARTKLTHASRWPRSRA